MPAKRSRKDSSSIGENPLWFKDAIIYEIPIRAYCDSNADGIGDINGLITKLDYLQDLGVTAVWLLPFYPSPLRDGGYDISDYTSVHPMYGTLADFKRLLQEAHDRGIRVITELVINHTSREHPWFERARRSPKGSKWRDFYVWSDDNTKYGETRIIFKDFETSNWTWDPVAGAYYWHRFYSHQPDLNFDNPDVHAAVFKALDFWFELGVDGLRMDAIPYLYEREGTNCENLPETHVFLKKLRAHLDSKFKDRMILAEANQWPQDAAAYFGDGDECHMNFNFPLMPRMFMAVQLQDRFPIIDILRQTPEIPATCQWATFLRNHDELTLEMVTDEDRDYMYRAYAEDPTARLNLGIRRRLAPLLRNRATIELMNGLLFSLPGTPVLYYGDEIGMGDNVYLGDRDGVRTPMQWSADRNAGFSQANPQKLFLPVVSDPEYRYEAINVQAQQANPASLLWWMKRTIALRKQHPALGAGTFELLLPENSKILAFLRVGEGEQVLVVANLSRFHQWVELELGRFEGRTPVEMSGLVRFPTVSQAPYRLCLAPFGFLWFVLEKPEAAEIKEGSIPHLPVKGPWTSLLAEDGRRPLEKALHTWIPARRWFRSKSRRIKGGTIKDVTPFKGHADQALVFYTVEFAEGDPETYLVPIVFLHGDDAVQTSARLPHATIAFIDGAQSGGIFDSIACGVGQKVLLDAVLGRATAKGSHGSLQGSVHKAFKEIVGKDIPEPRLNAFEQTNSAVAFGDRLLLKLYRQVETGVNAELEIGNFLTDKVKGAPVPRMLGSLTYGDRSGKNGDSVATIGLIQEFSANQGTAWDMTLGRLGTFFEQALTLHETTALPVFDVRPLTERGRIPVSPQMNELLGRYLAEVRLLGQRTAEVHLALASRKDDPAFAPEPFTLMHQTSIYQWSRSLLVRTFESLSRYSRKAPDDVRALAAELLSQEGEIDRHLRRITETKFDAQRIRCHGDLHLGQVLHTGQNFVIIDFEGEPGRPLNERRYKRCPLRDVMGMVRSFSYATGAVLRSGLMREADLERLRPWALAWEQHVSAAYVGAYLDAVKDASFIPRSQEKIDLLLSFYGMEKVIYEISYELNSRPDWVAVPITGLLTALKKA